MNIQTRAKGAIRGIWNQIRQAQEIGRNALNTSDYNLAVQRILRWRDRTATVLSRLVNRREAQRLLDTTITELSSTQMRHRPKDRLTRISVPYINALQALIVDLQERPEDIFAQRRSLTMPTLSKSRRAAVFVIHGHDEINRLRLTQCLSDECHLRVIVMAKKAGRGRPLIEKFEQEAKPAGFAFALLTPDDVVVAPGERYGQPRPNVVFELGWFYGRLGRKNVCILLKEGSRIHTDLDGVSRIEFKDSVLEKEIEIRRELVAAGLAGT